jgi:hypothetical protein
MFLNVCKSLRSRVISNQLRYRVLERWHVTVGARSSRTALTDSKKPEKLKHFPGFLLVNVIHCYQ